LPENLREWIGRGHVEGEHNRRLSMRLWQRRNNDLTVLMMLAVFSYTSSVIAAPIGEAELIASALKMPIIQAAEAEVEEVRAAGIKDGLLANPQLSFRRATGSQGASSLNSWSLAVPIDTAGRGATHRYVSASLRARAQASSEVLRSAHVLSVLQQFYSIAALRAEYELLDQAQTDFAEAARVIRHRVEAGTLPEVAAVRLELEAELLQSKARQSRSKAQRLSHELATLLGLDPEETSFSAKLDTPSIMPGKTEGRASMLSLKLAEEQAQKALNSRWRSWIPQLVIGAEANEQQGSPALLSLGFELPFFDRGQAQRAEAAATGERARREAQAHELQTAVDLRRSVAALDAAQKEKLRFQSRSKDRLEALMAATSSANRQGLLSPLEVLDAQRQQITIKKHDLALRLRVKMVELDLRAAQGEFE
jgi:outer membrane protein TolC